MRLGDALELLLGLGVAGVLVRVPGGAGVGRSAPIAWHDARRRADARDATPAGDAAARVARAFFR